MSVAFMRVAAAAVLLMPAVNGAFAQEVQVALQVTPEFGSRCVEVVNRAVAQDQQLNMQDCNGSPAQLFTYDQTKARLAVGGLCVDANGGKPGDIVKLASCNGSADQVWKSEPKGNFTKLVGTSGLCFDIRFGSTAAGALLQSWTCAEASANQLWRLRKP
jgi:ricin-type beta-trefoil lectin protein